MQTYRSLVSLDHEPLVDGSERYRLYFVPVYEQMTAPCRVLVYAFVVDNIPGEGAFDEERPSNKKN